MVMLEEDKENWTPNVSKEHKFGEGCWPLYFPSGLYCMGGLVATKQSFKEVNSLSRKLYNTNILSNGTLTNFS